MSAKLKRLLPLALVAALTGCGGDGGDDGDEVAEAEGQADVVVTADAAGAYAHVWVTIESIWFHRGSVEQPEDRGWLKFDLGEPMTVDLVDVSRGDFAEVFDDLALPVGTYHQVRLFLADSDEPLTGAAEAAGLQYNAQVDVVTDDGVVPEPLEILGPNEGVGVLGRFEISEGEPLTLALNFDVDRDVKSFSYEDETAYLLSPRLRYFDLAHVGAVTGTLDTSTLTPVEQVEGAYQVLISAQIPDDDGAYRQIERYTTVAADGSFALFPLFIPEGQDSVDYDIVIHGAGVQSVVIRDVPVNAGTAPASGGDATVLQSTALALNAGDEYAANLAQPASPTTALLHFHQTLADDGRSYLMRVRALNPFSGMLPSDVLLSAGAIQYGDYNLGQPIALTAAAPEEGEGGYRVLANAPYYVETAAAEPVQPAVADATAAIALPPLGVEAPAVATSISGTLMQETPGDYDTGYLIVSRLGYIVTTIPIDAQLAQDVGMGSTFSIDNLPGGTEAEPFDDARYYLYARVWNSADPEGTLRRSGPTPVDLSSGDVTGVEMVID